MALTNIVLVGATGNLGTPVLSALLSTPSLSTTVIARPSSIIVKNPPAGAKIVTLSFSDHGALVKALTGADALVITLGTASGELELQPALIRAAVDAGVQRIIPSEFGSDLDNPLTAALPVFAGKVETRKLLEQLAAEGKVSWTGLSNGPFLDWGLKNNFLLGNVKEKKITLPDGGARPFSTSTLADVAKAVVGILQHPEETKNRLVYIESARPTQLQLVAIYEKLSGIKLEPTVVATADIGKGGLEKISKGDFSGFFDLLIMGVFGEGYGSNFEGRLSNELFGIKTLDEAGLEEVVKEIL